MALRRAARLPAGRAAAGGHSRRLRRRRDPAQRRTPAGRPGPGGPAVGRPAQRAARRASSPRSTPPRRLTGGRRPRWRRSSTATPRLAADAGLDPIRGPGLVVTLTDAQRDANGRFPRDASPDDLVVHQQDIQAVLNALWSAAPRRSRCRISGSSPPRRRAASATRCCSTAAPTARPTSITAVGDAAAMQAALAAAPLVTLYKQYVVRFGLGYTEEPRAAVDLVGHTEPRADALRQAGRARSATERPGRGKACLVTWADAGLGRRQLRQLRVQPGPVPRPAGRGGARSGATTTPGCDRRRRRRGRRGLRRRAAQPGTGHPGARGRLDPAGARLRRGQDPAARGVPRAPGDRGGVRRHRRPRAGAAARQDQHRVPHECRCAARTSGSVHRDAVSLADDPARDAARRARGHRAHPKAA